MPIRPFADANVEAAFIGQPEPFQSRLLELRERVFDVAEAAGEGSPPIAPLIECLKWGEPSYSPVKPKIGSPIRIARHDERHVAVYFNCQTQLVEQFRERYGDELAYSKNRAILFDVNADFPEAILDECLRTALTYHWNRRQAPIAVT